MTEAEQDKIVSGLWDNLGRVMAEYPHLRQIGASRVTIENGGIVEDLFKAGTPCMMMSGHFGNWEIAGAAMLAQYGKALDLTYRAPNNPWADRLLMRARTLGGAIRCYPKSRAGAQQILQAMRDKRTLAILIDQKYNGGVAVPFLGRPAMTNPVFVQLCQKYGYALIPARIKRTDGARFTITFFPPLDLHDSANAPLPIETVIGAAHRYLEQWVRDTPEQWLWLHRRWDSQKLLNDPPSA